MPSSSNSTAPCQRLIRTSRRNEVSVVARWHEFIDGMGRQGLRCSQHIDIPPEFPLAPNHAIRDNRSEKKPISRRMVDQKLTVGTSGRGEGQSRPFRRTLLPGDCSRRSLGSVTGQRPDRHHQTVLQICLLADAAMILRSGPQGDGAACQEQHQYRGGDHHFHQCPASLEATGCDVHGFSISTF